MLRLLFHILTLSCFVPAFSQEQPTADVPSKWSFNGYISHLQTVMPQNHWNDILLDQLVHNRLNFRWYPSGELTGVVEFRNRLIFGNLVRLTPNYPDLLRENHELADLSLTVFETRSALMHLKADRLYLQWSRNKWEITMGRQRINWGISAIWNPNDLFNAFSFFDFDYEERPGSDAFRLVYHYGAVSNVEMAVRFNREFSDMVMAGKWLFNKERYDFQLLAGFMENHLAAGGGWAGHIGGAGFKGEVAAFYQPGDNSNEQLTLSATFSVDYIFANGLYWINGILYNSNTDSAGLLTGQSLSARQLSPYEYNLLSMFQYPFSPIITGGVAVLYAPGSHDIYFNPNLSLSIAENWDLQLLSQMLYQTTLNQFHQFYFLRTRWSF